jgi:hypothetical protein
MLELEILIAMSFVFDSLAAVASRQTACGAPRGTLLTAKRRF